MTAIDQFLASMPYASSKKYKHLGPLVGLITWQMIAVAEARCDIPSGEVESRSAVVLSACGFLTSKGIVIPKGNDTATYLRKTCGKLFWRLVSLRFSPARLADAATYAAFLEQQAEEAFRRLIIEQIDSLPNGPEFTKHRSLRYGLQNLHKRLTSDEARAVTGSWEREATQMRALISVGRELFK